MCKGIQRRKFSFQFLGVAGLVAGVSAGCGRTMSTARSTIARGLVGRSTWIAMDDKAWCGKER